MTDEEHLEHMIRELELTDAEAALARKHTRAVPSSGGDRWVELVVGVQGFRLRCEYPKDEAAWSRCMLGKALANIG